MYVVTECLQSHSPTFQLRFIPPLDECPLSLGSLESADMTDATDEFRDPLERDNSFAMSSNVLESSTFPLKYYQSNLISNN